MLRSAHRPLILPVLLGLLAGTSACDGAAPPRLPTFAESTTQPAGEEMRLQGRVNDAAGILSRDVERRLNSRLAALETATGHQLVVATVPTLGQENIADYTLYLARRWGIGRRGHDDGVVVLVAPNDRRVRIEVGYGLEKMLTDPFCKVVIDRDMLPQFKHGDFAGGLERGVESLIAKLT